jgi:hypothetical protein
LGRALDLTGQRFGRLVALRRVENDPLGQARWEYACDCGATTPVLGRSLRRGNTRSCGCSRIGQGFIDLTGRRLGRLTVLGRGPDSKQGKARWECVCDCGNRHIAESGSLTYTRSCGCLIGESTKARFTRHAMYGTPEYNAWANLRRRCENPNHPAYEFYGGRGITVHSDWQTFEGFYADMGRRPGPDYWLKRIDTSSNYSADNCAWDLRPVRARKRWSGRKVATDIKAKKRERERLRDLLKHR